MTEDIYAVVMAGGRGERFWPLSRTSRPKQLLRLIGDVTMIEATVSRLDGFIPPENTVVITNSDYLGHVRELLDKIPPRNIIGEPCGRDTAPCIALASAVVSSISRSSDTVMLLLPADHIINDSSSLTKCLSDCAKVAQGSRLVAIGITPDEPSTAYGYIKYSSPMDLKIGTSFFKAEKFMEKPDTPTAENFLRDGNYKWNSGMFAWSCSTIASEMERFAPEIASFIPKARDAHLNNSLDALLLSSYHELPKISIDYAVMEKSDRLVLAEASFDWDDIGNWTALRNQLAHDKDNNVSCGLHAGIDSKNCIVYGNGSHLIATAGVDDLIIIHTDDATLVCRSDKSQDIKRLISILSNNEHYRHFL